MHALISIHDYKFKSLAELTWEQNKVVYATKHGYDALCKTDGFDPTVGIGFQKILIIKELLVARPDLEWIWWTGCDTLITNTSIKIEDRLDNNYHFIIASDCNGLNADSFLIRNSPEGRGFIDHIWNIRDSVKDDAWQEQRAIINSVEQFVDIIKIIPQRDLNAYNTAVYNNQSHLDSLGNVGTWRPGDWLIHWPGLSLERRIWLACFYKNYIV